MAKLNEQGSVIARCPGCEGGQSTFEWSYSALGMQVHPQFPVGMNSPSFGRVCQRSDPGNGQWRDVLYLMLRCAGCGRGGIAVIQMKVMQDNKLYPQSVERLLSFFPEARERLKLPPAVPDGIKSEFREAERCMEAECFRAAAGLFRSVLDKTMRANDYKKERNLKQQIDAAASDGVITESRRKRAHEDIRVLGNDVLHEDWVAIPEQDVEEAHHYAQRILEDFYDHRPTTLATLVAKGRTPDDAKTP
jgi:hypothetical protein